MQDNRHLIMSIEPRFVAPILSGSKIYELRRRLPNVPAGSRVWFYVKQPVAEISMTALIAELQTEPTHQLWDSLGHRTGVTKDEFLGYFDGREHASALMLEHVQRLTYPVALPELRELNVPQPPQFYLNVRIGPLLDRLTNALCPLKACANL